MMRTNLHHAGRLWAPLALILLFSGCVTVEPDRGVMEINDLPPEHAAVFVAVNWDVMDNNMLAVEFDENHAVMLRPNAINRIYLPEGWYTLTLPNLRQAEKNQGMRYRFSAGDIYRFALLKREPKADPDAPEGTPPPQGPTTYTLAPSTRDAFQQLLLQDQLPVVELHAGALGGS